MAPLCHSIGGRTFLRNNHCTLVCAVCPVRRRHVWLFVLHLHAHGFHCGQLPRDRKAVVPWSIAALPLWRNLRYLRSWGSSAVAPATAHCPSGPSARRRVEA
eukprot:1825489-Pleurochrysis_carterae.AAC.9